MKILMPGRILDKHVGGNTTYARAIAGGARQRGVEVESMSFYANPVLTMAAETLIGVRHRECVLHYVADTGPLLRTRTPSVVTVHGVASRWVSGVRNARQERVWRTRVARAIESTNAVITVSESSADDIADIFNIRRQNITVIPHGIELKKFKDPVTLSDPVRSLIPPKYLLYVGNIEPRKNLLALVQAMEHPTVKELGLPLVIAGKPAWNYGEAMDAIRSCANVIHLGFVSDTDRSALMQQAELFVFPSLYEGFGFPVLEAMAAGAPVLTSHFGALKEVAGPAKVLKTVDRDAIATGIVEAIHDTAWRSKVVSLGQAWSASYTWDASVDAHIALYERIGAK